MKGIIYKYTFPDGKVYIGQTRNPEKRKRDHIDPSTGPANTGFWEAYQRFGTYEYEVIHEIESDNEDELINLLNWYESGFIFKYKADNPQFGYNRMSYGHVSSKNNQILKRAYNAIQKDIYDSEIQLFESASNKMWHTKKPLTKEETFLITEKYPEPFWFDNIKDIDFRNPSNNKLSENQYFNLEEHFGMVRSLILDYSFEVAKHYISKYGNQIIAKARSENAIVQIDKEGNVIKEYDSILEICQAFNIPRGDNVRNVLRGRQKTAYGYYWKYKRDYENEK